MKNTGVKYYYVSEETQLRESDSRHVESFETTKTIKTTKKVSMHQRPKGTYVSKETQLCKSDSRHVAVHESFETTTQRIKSVRQCDTVKTTIKQPVKRD
jgi:hypothetical protein